MKYTYILVHLCVVTGRLVRLTKTLSARKQDQDSVSTAGVRQTHTWSPCQTHTRSPQIACAKQGEGGWIGVGGRGDQDSRGLQVRGLRHELAATTPACMQRAGTEAKHKRFSFARTRPRTWDSEAKTRNFHSARSAGREAAAAVGQDHDAVAAAEIAISVGVIAGASPSWHFTMPGTHERLCRQTLRPHSAPPPVESSSSREGARGGRGVVGGVQALDEATSQQGSRERVVAGRFEQVRGTHGAHFHASREQEIRVVLQIHVFEPAPEDDDFLALRVAQSLDGLTQYHDSDRECMQGRGEIDPT